jgi:glycyl-tRNA synthetase
VTLAFLVDAFQEEELENGDTREVLKFHPALAPYKVAVLPLVKKLNGQAMEVFAELSKHMMVDYDEAGTIGKRYRRQDAIGTPFCVTFDFDSLEDKMVTVRHRDSMEQLRMPIADLRKYIEEKIQF